jgi:hypothetical protein
MSAGNFEYGGYKIWYSTSLVLVLPFSGRRNLPAQSISETYRQVGFRNLADGMPILHLSILLLWPGTQT